MINTRTRKSVELNQEEMKAFKKWLKNQPSKFEAAEILGVNRNTLDRILLLNSCSAETKVKLDSVVFIELTSLKPLK